MDLFELRVLEGCGFHAGGLEFVKEMQKEVVGLARSLPRSFSFSFCFAFSTAAGILKPGLVKPSLFKLQVDRSRQVRPDRT